MKARLVPLFFQSGKDTEFVKRIEALRRLLVDEADILEPRALGSALPDADAVVFPRVLGDAYRQLNDIKALDLPVLFITSEFGTVSMWDWEDRELFAFQRSGADCTVKYFMAKQARTP